MHEGRGMNHVIITEGTWGHIQHLPGKGQGGHHIVTVLSL
jgi:hypothetical protein